MYAVFGQADAQIKKIERLTDLKRRSVALRRQDRHAGEKRVQLRSGAVKRRTHKQRNDIMTLAQDGAWANIVRYAKPQMRQGIDQHPAEEEQACRIAIGEEMPNRPEDDSPGEREAQDLPQPAAE